MKMRSWVLGVAAASLAAGCGLNGAVPGTGVAGPGAQTTVVAGQEFSTAEADRIFAQAESEARAALPVYRVQADATAAEQELTVNDVQASSVRSDYFRLSYVTDGNTHSAWGPAATDAEPSLTFQLADTFQLSGMVVKLSPAGATMDVAVASGAGGWTPIATGVAPAQYEAMSRVDLPASVGDRVKITFHGVAAKDLLVCEVHWFGTAAPASTPTPVATPTPVVTPTPAPKPTPKPMDCGVGLKGVGTLGGGCMPTTFALQAVSVPGKGVSGFVTLYTGGKVLIGNVSVIQQQGKTYTVSGKLCGSGKAYSLVVVESATAKDAITFTTEDDFTLTGTLRCGNIRYTALPCDVKTVKSPCQAHLWGKCYTKEFRGDYHNDCKSFSRWDGHAKDDHKSFGRWGGRAEDDHKFSWGRR